MPHYYSEKQDSELNLKKIKIKVRGFEFELYSGAGVFSKDRLDKGTQLLIEKATIEPKWRLLDFGCGIGVVGISLKMQYPDTKVLMTDVNERAVLLSKKNIKLHNLQEIEAKKSNLYETIHGKFDTILVNPPQTAGKEICFAIIETAKTHLNKGGLLQLVARAKKGGKSLEKKMKETFGNADIIARSSGYRVYVSKN